MSKPLSFYGQLNYTKITKALKSGQIKAQRIQTKDGEEIVFDANFWVNAEADQFNNNASVQCQLKKEAYEAGAKNPYYIGNFRYQIAKTTDATEEDIAKLVKDEDDDLAF